MKKAYVIAIFLVIILGLSYGVMRYLANQKELPRQVASPEVVRYVETDDVHYNDIPSVVSGKGRVLALASLEIISEGAGKILPGDVPLKNGQSFKKGQILFSIYKDEVELNLKAMKSGFMNLIANVLPDIKVDYPEHYEQFLTFFNAIEVGKDLPELPDYKSGQLKLFLASKNLLSQYYTILQNQKAVSRYTVFAPFDGVYSQVNLEVGAYTNVGGRIAQAIQTTAVEVELAVDAEDASFIGVGDKVSLFGDQQWSGKVVRISGHVDEGTQSRLVYVRVDANKDLPVPGQYLNASFRGKILEQVMEIPRSALFNFNEVYTIVSERLMKRPVTIVKRNENTVFFRGLNEGDIVVTEGLIGVSDGSSVKRLRDAPKENPNSGKKGNNKAQ